MRVVSLACSNTEIVAALGCAHLLVGIDDHSDYPESLAAHLPRLGPELQIDTDRVVALQPDLVLASLTVPGHEAVVERLERAALPFLAPSPTSLADVYADIRHIASRLHVPERGEAVVSAMRAQLQAAPPPRQRPGILIQWWPAPVIAPAGQSWATDLIVLAGGQNPIGDEALKSRPLTDEEVAALAPDAIVLSWCGIHPTQYRPETVLGNPAWRDVAAIRNARVFSVPEAYLGRPGPRLVHGAKALRSIVQRVARDSASSP